MSHHHDDSGDSSQSGPNSGDTPDVEPGTTQRVARDGLVDEGWLRPRVRRHLGRPRVSTMLLALIWIAALVAYVEFRPGG